MKRIVLLFSTLFVILLFAGYLSPADPTSTAHMTNDEIPALTEVEGEEPPATMTESIMETIPEPASTETETPTEIVLITPEMTDECLECDQDKQRLINTAKPEEEQVSESSGEG